MIVIEKRKDYVYFEHKENNLYYQVTIVQTVDKSLKIRVREFVDGILTCHNDILNLDFPSSDDEFIVILGLFLEQVNSKRLQHV